jgi:hypothetical protein
MSNLIYKYLPIITTRSKRDDFVFKYVKDAEYNLHRRYEQFIRFKDKSTWAAINPVIHSLLELRKNTWDKERVDHAIEWLEKNFEVKDDNSRHDS